MISSSFIDTEEKPTIHLQLPSIPKRVDLQVKILPLVKSVLLFASIGLHSRRTELAGGKRQRRGSLGNIRGPSVLQMLNWIRINPLKGFIDVVSHTENVRLDVEDT